MHRPRLSRLGTLLSSCSALRCGAVRCGCALTSLLETYGQTLAICDSFLRSSPKINGLETMHHAPAKHRVTLCDQHPAASSSAMTTQQAAASKQASSRSEGRSAGVASRTKVSTRLDRSQRALKVTYLQHVFEIQSHRAHAYDIVTESERKVSLSQPKSAARSQWMSESDRHTDSLTWITPAAWTADRQEALRAVEVVHDRAPLRSNVVACAKHVVWAPGPIGRCSVPSHMLNQKRLAGGIHQLRIIVHVGVKPAVIDLHA